MPQKTNEVRLECTTGGHNKQYTLWLEEPKPGQWVVNFHYGAIGNSPLQGTKTQNPVNRPTADLIYTRLMNEKLAKGYVQTGSVSPSYTNVPAKKAAASGSYGIQFLPPMLLTAADESMLAAFIKNDDWVAQQKMNGKRIIIEVFKDKVVGYNKKCQECPIEADVADELKYCKPLLLDGEMVNGVFHVFDALVLDDKSIVANPYETRRDKLMTWFDGMSNLNKVKLVPHSYGEDAKKKLVATLQKNNEEGVVFKNVNAPYVSGKVDSLSSARAVKIKFYREDSFEVISWNQKSSIEVGAYDKNDNLVSVGNVTVPAKYVKQIEKGCVVRIRYLYATKANQLYQPALQPDEDGDVSQADVNVTECLLARLKYEGKADPKKSGKDDDIGRNILV